MRKVSIRAKLVRLFTLQILLISVATISGIYVTNTLVQDLLMRSALDGEAAHFWAEYTNNKSHAVPNTDNLIGYLEDEAGQSAAPIALTNVDETYGRLAINDRKPIFHISESGGRRLYLLFDGDAVSDLAFLYGIAPLSLVLLVIYGLSFLAYRASQQAVSPIVRLARHIDAIDLTSRTQHKFDLDHLRDPADAEVSSMIAAVESLGQRLDNFVERERLFTRDASHELRTPIAVFKGSLDLLERRQQMSANPLSDGDEKILLRMRRSVEGMETLVETLLLLAREDGITSTGEDNIAPLVRAQVDALQPLAEQSNNTLTVSATGPVANTHPRVIEILTTNLVSNALQFTRDGSVSVDLSNRQLSVTDSGPGMDQETQARMFQPFFRGPQQAPSRQEQGYGLGLAIVKRLVEQCGWHLEVQSELNKGTCITVLFDAGPRAATVG